ncbi:MAG: glycosyltransferase family 25 protein [Sulfuritalea sp.]|nr:glycosyltransferase family 25 protein [Sulfuritalea sp.]
MIPAGKFKVFVVSLAGSADRRRLMAGQLDQPGFPVWEFLDAVEGRKLSAAELEYRYDENAARRRYGKGLSPGHVGCALSHLDAYRRMQSEDLAAALILEDDALIGEHALQVIERLLARLSPAEPTLVLLSHAKYYRPFGGWRLDRERKVFPIHMARGTHGYLLTRAAADRILTTMPKVTVVPDHWELIRDLCKVRIQAVVPYPVGRSPIAGYSGMPTPPPSAADNARKRNGQWRKLRFQLGKIACGSRKQPASW